MVSRGDTAQRDRRVTLAVVAITFLGLLARFAFLGERIAHWDEARVAYWILHYTETGAFEYQPIIHGPFLQQVNRFVFELLGANDFTMRLVVALLGAALPLVALLLRNRLRGAETVALALFLAANPVLLYYSRFMRSDVPLAVFMLFAFGFFVRALDTRRLRYFHAGVLSLALGFTTKENVLIYLVTWLGALVLLADHRLFLNRGFERGWWTALRKWVERTDHRLQTQFRHEFIRACKSSAHILVAILELFAIVVYFYAPRTNGEKPGFDTLLAEPTTLPSVIGEATLGSWDAFYSLWVSGGHQDHSYLPYLGDFLGTLAAGAGALVVLAIVGFLADRYAGERPRDLVAFPFYWGLVSVLGYPIITDIKAPWVTVHAIVPLAIPAAVGVCVLYRRGRTALKNDNRIAVGAVAVVLFLVVAQVAFVAVTSVYLYPQSGNNPLVQYAQPTDDLRPTIRDMIALSAQHEGTDVLLYGDYLVADEPENLEPTCSAWFNILPLPWYTNIHDMTVSCAANSSAFEAKLDGTQPPVVISLATDRAFIAAHLEGYDARSYVIRTQDTAQTNTTFFVNESRLSKNTTEQGNP